MTNQEFSQFARRLFVAFPDVWEWLNQNSPDVAGTQEVWRSQLRDFSLEECLLVLDAWINGKRPLFKHFERGHLGLVIRASISFDRERERKRAQADGSSSEYVKVRRDRYQPLAQHLPQLGAIYRQGAALKKRFIDGEIDQAAYEQEKQALIESVR